MYHAQCLSSSRLMSLRPSSKTLRILANTLCALDTEVFRLVEGVPTDTAAVEITHAYIINFWQVQAQSVVELYMHERFAAAAVLVGTPSTRPGPIVPKILPNIPFRIS